MSKLMKRICNEKLMIQKRDFVEHNENKPLPTLMFLPMMIKMPVTENTQKLHLVNPSPVRRNILAKRGEGVHLGGG